MKHTHTPGPWSVEIDHHNNAPELIRAHIDGEMFDVASILCDETGNAAANARLIAAAPKLLQVLQDILPEFIGLYERFDPTGQIAVWEQWTEEAMEAIAEATGGEQ